MGHDERVVTGPAAHDIAAPAANQNVIALPAVDRIVTVPAIDHVMATEPLDHVLSDLAQQDVVAVRCPEEQAGQMHLRPIGKF